MVRIGGRQTMLGRRLERSGVLAFCKLKLSGCGACCPSNVLRACVGVAGLCAWELCMYCASIVCTTPTCPRVCSCVCAKLPRVMLWWLCHPLGPCVCVCVTPTFVCPSATTHTDMVLRAKNLGIPVQVIHNASVMTAVGACGVNLYNYGQTVSIPFFTETWQPDSFYDKLAYNLKGGMHTLCLLGTQGCV